jgi:type VI protein secretion system component Hcp
MKFRIDGQWRWLVALGGILIPGIVFGAFSVPHTFEAGTPIKASEMNANFEAIAAKLDAQANPPVAPSIGTLTLDGVVSELPITKFSQSINVPWTVGTTPGKAAFSEIVVQRAAGAGTPDLNRTAAMGNALKTATIVLGNLTIELENVRVTGASVVETRGGLPQEAIALFFRAITWTWDDGENPVTSVSFDLQTYVGGGASVDGFSFGYFPAGVAPDATYTPIAGYKHQLGCPAPAAACKVAHGPIVVSKRVAGDTLAEINAVVTFSPVSAALDWFADDSTVNNSVSLEDSRVTSWSITTSEDGTLDESVGFTYTKIRWTAGITESGWNVAANMPL